MRYSGACFSLCIMPHAKLKNDAVGVDAESCNERPEPEPEVPALGIGCGRVGGRRYISDKFDALHKYVANFFTND